MIGLIALGVFEFLQKGEYNVDFFLGFLSASRNEL